MNIDDYRLGKNGDINLIKKTDDDHDVLYASNNDGTTNENKSIEVEKGVLDSKNVVNIPAQSSNGDICNATVDEYTTTSNSTGRSLFEFAAQNSNVEWSQTTFGGGTNYITTSHISNAEVGMPYEIGTKISDKNPLLEANHNHPGNSVASTADVGLSSQFPNACFNIYTLKYGYEPYTNMIPEREVGISVKGRPQHKLSIPSLSKSIGRNIIH